MKKLKSNGSLLITLTVLYLLISLSMGFVLLNSTEMSDSRRYYHSTAAFWLAEAGINMYMKNPSMLNNSSSMSIPYGEGLIYLVRDDSKPMFRLITATGVIGGVEKRVQISYTANIPEAYKNTLSSKGDIRISGQKASFIINDKVRLTGKVIGQSKYGTTLFEDLQSNQDPSLTSLSYPTSAMTSEKIDEFQNFVQNNNDIIAKYPSDQILHVKTDGTYTLPTDGSLKNKKIIFIEGSLAGGNVIIESNGIVAQDQNLTIISTGNVTFNQSGLQALNSQLNIIAWQGYNETVSAASSHQGLIYTHGTATFDKIRSSSINNGAIIADGGIVFGEIWSTKIFNYADMTKGKIYPPGFEKLVGASKASVSAYPHSWKEL